MKKIFCFVFALAAVLIAGVVWLRNGGETDAGRSQAELDGSVPEVGADPSVADEFASGGGRDEAVDSDESGPLGEEETPLTEEEKREAEEEKKVEVFDGLTDKWMEPAAKGVSMADVDAFVRSFRAVPKARQDECVHRALNLVPDENVMLLAGILLDRSVGEDVAATIFADILNRDEDVKKVILLQVYKDKSHPCWADAAWILDVTGEQNK